MTFAPYDGSSVRKKETRPKAVANVLSTSMVPESLSPAADAVSQQTAAAETMKVKTTAAAIHLDLPMVE